MSMAICYSEARNAAKSGHISNNTPTQGRMYPKEFVPCSAASGAIRIVMQITSIPFVFVIAFNGLIEKAACGICMFESIPHFRLHVIIDIPCTGIPELNL